MPRPRRRSRLCWRKKNNAGLERHTRMRRRFVFFCTGRIDGYAEVQNLRYMDTLQIHEGFTISSVQMFLENAALDGALF
jgi:hypothetical protein